MGSYSNPYLPENIFVKEKNGKYLVFNPNKPAWLVTNQLGVFILKLCNGTNSVKSIHDIVAKHNNAIEAEALSKFLDNADCKGIFVVKKPKLSPPMFSLRSVYLNLTEQCNLQCMYCYAEERTKTERSLSLSNYIEILNAIKRIAPGEIIIHYTGGEPLTSPVIFDIAQYSHSLGMRNFLLTNGTLITPDNVSKIIKLFDDIKISLDGSTAEVNDITRGKGTYNKILNALELLDASSKEYKLSMTVTKKNIYDIENMARRFGGKLNFAPYFHRRDDSINNNLAISGSEYFQALRDVIGINPYCEIDSLITANLEKRVIQRCSLADGSISISSNGDVYPCQLLHFNEFKAGNVLESSFNDIYSTSPVLLKLRNHTVNKIEGCSDCPISLLCGGGCLARHYYETGTLEIAGNFCEYEQLAILDALLDRYEL